MGSIGWRHLRQRFASIVLLGVVGAVVFGGALTAIAGARRSSTALDRFLAYSRAEDTYVTPAEDGGLDMTAVDHLPQVAAAAYQSYLAMVPFSADGRPDLEAAGSINPFLYTPLVGPPDAIARRRIIRGRDLDPSDPDEAVIDEELAERYHLVPGSRLRMATYSAAQLATLFDAPQLPEPEGPLVELSVVGIGRLPTDLHPPGETAQLTYGGTMDLYLSPAFYPAYGDEVATYLPPIDGTPHSLLLRHGAADQAAFEAAVRRLPGGEGASIDVGGSDAGYAAITARRAIAVETTALAALGVALAIGGAVLIGHGVARLARAASDELDSLRCLGVGPADLRLIAAAPGAVASATAALGAVAVAVAASRWTPIGLGRSAEISPGMHVDHLVVGLGGAILMLVGPLLSLATAAPTVRGLAARRHRAPRRPSRLGDTLGAVGAPLTATLGARFATEPPGQRRAPLRYASGVGALALLVVAGVVTYGHSVDHLVASRDDQGAHWDLTIGNPNNSDFGDDYADLLTDPMIDGLSALASPEGRVSINGSQVAIAGLDQLVGDVGPQPSTGRLPAEQGEVLLGLRTASRLHVGVGDQIEVRANAATVPLTVVGTAVLNPGLAFTMEIGEGSIVTIAQMQSLLEDTTVNGFVANVAPGTPIDDAIASLHERYDSVSRPALAPEAINLRRVRGLPIALAIALAGAAAVLLAVALLTAARDRRADVLVLRAIGATRRQVSAALAWQGVWLYGVALVGLPVGVAAGRMVWGAVIDRIGALAEPHVRYSQLGTIALIGLLVSVVLAGGPALRVARVRGAHAREVD